MSYSEEELLRDSNNPSQAGHHHPSWMMANSAASWNHHLPHPLTHDYYHHDGPHNSHRHVYHQAQPTTQWMGAYATLNRHRPKVPSKPPRRPSQEYLISSSGSASGQSGLLSQHHLSKSQHQLTHSTSYYPNVNHHRRMSEDESAYLSSLSSQSSSFKPVGYEGHHQRGRKPVPPVKPPRSNGSSSGGHGGQSKSSRNYSMYSMVPPPEGYGNIKRSASNDIDAFFNDGPDDSPPRMTSFTPNSTSSGFSSSMSRSTTTTVIDQDHLYDEIAGHQATDHRHSMHGGHPGHGHHHHNHIEPYGQVTRHPPMIKHLRSKSEHHQSRYLDDDGHVYDSPANSVNDDNVGSEVTPVRSSQSFQVKRVVPLPPTPPASKTKAPPPPPSQTSRPPTEDEYAVVLRAPPPEVALKSIRSVIKPLLADYKKAKRLESRRRSEATSVEEKFFPIFDVKTGKKVTVKERSNDRIPLLVDMSTMTDPLPKGFFDNPFSILCRSSSKVLSESEKLRSLKRTKHHTFVHVGTAERRKKKLTLSQAKVPAVPAQQPTPPPTSTIVIKPIEIDIDGLEGHLKVSPLFDDRKEWAEIESIMASFDRRSKSPREVDEGQTTKKDDLLTVSKSGHHRSTDLRPGLEGVRDFLFSIQLPDYTPLFVSHGFDDVRFMGPNVLEESDLKEIGVKNADHVKKIISSAKKSFPKLPVVDVTSTLDQWLSSLSLDEYRTRFLENGFTDINKVKKIWEVELVAVLDVGKVGHRKRILASLGERVSLMSDLGLDDLDFSVSQSKSPSPNPIPKPTQLAPPEVAPKATKRSPTPPPRPASRPRSTASLLSIASVPQWKHDPRLLVDRRIDYSAFYLGSTLVKQLLGIESTRESIKKLKESTKDQDKIPSVVLSISFKGVQFIDGHSRSLVCEHEIRNIHCACQDTDDFRHFAYITKDHETSNHYCHVFSALSLDLATEVILTLGQAFEVAYQLALGVDINDLSSTYRQAKTSKEEKDRNRHSTPDFRSDLNGNNDLIGAKSMPTIEVEEIDDTLKVTITEGLQGDDDRSSNPRSPPTIKRGRVKSRSKSMVDAEPPEPAPRSGLVGTLSRAFEDKSRESSMSPSQVISATRIPVMKGHGKPVPPAKPANISHPKPVTMTSTKSLGHG